MLHPAQLLWMTSILAIDRRSFINLRLMARREQEIVVIPKRGYRIWKTLAVQQALEMEVLCKLVCVRVIPQEAQNVIQIAPFKLNVPLKITYKISLLNAAGVVVLSVLIRLLCKLNHHKKEIAEQLLHPFRSHQWWNPFN